MSPSSAKVGHILAKGLGIKVQNPEPYRDPVTRGESVRSIQSTDTFVEQAPTTADWLRETLPNGRELREYAWSLFPFIHWIGHYNVQWLIGDLVAGVTVGAVVVPQGMAYAGLANLDPQFGLYSSFMGVLIYWFFATSKDITIGPVAVMSTIVGGVVADLKVAVPEYANTPHVYASALSILAGSIVLAIGLARCGWIVDLIPLTALSAFMTGSAINIAVGQMPALMGITGFSNRDATYLVFINTLKGLPRTKLDAAMGLTALTMLYLIRSACSFAAKKWPQHRKTAFFLSTLRTAFVILLYTMISWLVNMNSRTSPKFKILLDVPRGFQDAAVPIMNTRLASTLASYLPSSVIVLLIEHVAIAKSFGRVNNYTINPSQEMVAIGVTNVLSPFLGGYPATGSFSRTAIKSKAGVRTPFAGVITALVVLLAIYALPPVFYYIPSASLSAVIIHAVGDLITPPNTVYRFWLVNPLEVFIFFTGVIVTVFTNIENGIYCTVSISAAILLFRILKARGNLLGKVKIHSVLGDHVIGDSHNDVVGNYDDFEPSAQHIGQRNIFLPLDHNDGSNPEVELTTPYPGILIYRFSEGFNYPNASHSLEYLTDYIFKITRRTNLESFARPGDRPWNDPGPSRRQLKKLKESGDVSAVGVDADRPTLKAIILDFSAVNNVDITSIQQLIDIRNQLDRYTAPDVVDWHLACISNRWTKRALVSAGFGYPTERPDGLHHRWQPIFSVAEIGGRDSAAAAAEKARNLELRQSHDVSDIEQGKSGGSSDGEISKSKPGNSKIAARTQKSAIVHGLNRPLFHVDLTSALQAAIANVEARGASGHSPVSDVTKEA